jgi:hypothetical protein
MGVGGPPFRVTLASLTVVKLVPNVARNTFVILKRICAHVMC